jgi:hypothetical protein
MSKPITFATRAGKVTWENLKQELLSLPKETLVELFNIWMKNLWSTQSYWMVFAEEAFGFDAAGNLDGKVWEKTAPIQAYRTKKVLNLGDDIQALATTLKFTAPQWVTAGFEWEFVEVNDRRLTITIHKCPMGTYRKENNLPLLPCKEVAPSLYKALARVINEKIETRCLHAHPDPPKPDTMCEWEFVLEE